MNTADQKQAEQNLVAPSTPNDDLSVIELGVRFFASQSETYFTDPANLANLMTIRTKLSGRAGWLASETRSALGWVARAEHLFESRMIELVNARLLENGGKMNEAVMFAKRQCPTERKDQRDAKHYLASLRVLGKALDRIDDSLKQNIAYLRREKETGGETQIDRTSPPKPNEYRGRREPDEF